MPEIQCPHCKTRLVAPERTPKVRCHSCKNIIDVLLVPLGWLVVHDEHAIPYTYPLKIGPNIIGRAAQNSDVDFQIEFLPQRDDREMSRRHCEVNVVDNTNQRTYNFLLRDLSKNGTILNADQRNLLYKELDIIYLKHDDVIQLSKTKLVLQLYPQVKSQEDAERRVRRTGYSQTIIYSSKS